MTTISTGGGHNHKPGCMCPYCVSSAAMNEAEAVIINDDEAMAPAYMAFMDRGAPPEPETYECSECGGYLMDDPDGSPGVLVHVDDYGNRDYDADEDHTGIDADEVVSINQAYPNARCRGCGSGLDENGLCFQNDCYNFNEASDYAKDGHTTSGEPVSTVSVSSLRRGDRVIIDGTYAVVTSLDNDHNSTSIELDGDEETIASYDNLATVKRYDGDPHPMPGDLVYWTAEPNTDGRGWVKVDADARFSHDVVEVTDRFGNHHKVPADQVAQAPAPVFGPRRPNAALRAIHDYRNALATREEKPFSDAALDWVTRAKRVREQYSEYGDDYRG